MPPRKTRGKNKASATGPSPTVLEAIRPSQITSETTGPSPTTRKSNGPSSHFSNTPALLLIPSAPTGPTIDVHKPTTITEDVEIGFAGTEGELSGPEVLDDPVIVFDNAGSRQKRWTTEESAKLLAVLHDERNHGNQSDNGWKKTVWTMASSELHRVGIIRSSKSCKERWNGLKAQFLSVKKLLEFSGFGWDEGRQIVVGEQGVWDRLNTIENKKLMEWRHMPFPLYNDMVELVGGRHATGGDALSISTSFNPTLPPTDDNFPDSISALLPSSYGSRSMSLSATSSLQSIIPQTPPPSLKWHPTSPPPSEPAKKKPNSTDIIANVMQKMVTAITDNGSDGPSTPSRRKLAVATASKDYALTKEERISLIVVLQNDVGMVDTYLGLAEDDEIQAEVVRRVLDM